MGSPKKPPSHAPINLDGLFDVPAQVTPRAEPIITGLSEEEDAQRHIAVRFNPDLLVCPNCEITFDTTQVGDICPRCQLTLYPLGTSMLSARRKHT